MGGLEGEVLRRLRDTGPQTKVQLAQALDVPRTTLSASLRSLTAAGHVEDGPLAPSSGGRRSVSVRVAASRVVVGVSLGERRVRVAVLDGHLTIANRASIDLHECAARPEPIADIVLRATRQGLDGRLPVAVAIAAADQGSPLLGELQDRLAEGYDRASITSLPAVRAMALGERRAGAARGVDDFLAVRLGRSVTTATVAGGHLGKGVAGLAGEIGHLRVEEFGPACVCGLTGCLDSFAGSVALEAQATELARRGRSATLREALHRKGALDLADLVAAGRAGDPVVAQLAHDVGQRLGRVVAGLVVQTNPRRVVLGGPVAALGGQLLSDLRATVYRVAPAPLAEGLEIVLSDLGEQAVLIGTGSAGLDAWIAAGTGARPTTCDENGHNWTADGPNCKIQSDRVVSEVAESSRDA